MTRLSTLARSTSRARSVLGRTAAVGAASALVAGFLLLSAGSASAVGTGANTITAGSVPAAGSVRGSFTPTATATSGDKVVITLDKTSSGCSISDGKVTFTAAGTCVVDDNDPGNSTYAAAAEVHQDVKVYAANTISASASPSSGSTGGSYSPGASATSGDAVVKTIDGSSTGCSISDGKVTFTGAGTCRVNLNDPGNGAFAAASQVRQTITVHSANTIYASTPPAAGTINGTYATGASATSGDTVVISLAGGSTGCTLDKKLVTFSGNGVCEIDFNDVGNGAYAAATQVQQSITVGVGNPRAQATLTLTSIRAIHGRPLTLVTSGGSGVGAVTYAVTAAGSAGCWISDGQLKTTRAGTCEVTATKSADATYAAARSLATTVSVAVSRPLAERVSAPVWTGQTVTTKIIGTGFYGRPRIITSAAGTKIVLLRDTGRVITVRVSVKRGTRRGEHTFTLIFARGQRTSLHYNQR
jgi:hypothetical protein